VNLDLILGGRAIAPAVRDAAEKALPRLYEADDRRPAVRMRVIEAFLAEGIAESDLWGSTGYGYDDPARERFEWLLARVLRAERVLARLSLVSGTHAILAALDALTPHGALLLCANGAPYDTLRYAIAEAPHSLVARGIAYAEVPRTPVGGTDLAALAAALTETEPAVVFVQRSRGYAARRSLSIDDIAAVVEVVRMRAKRAVVLVDNCYGELVEEREPLEAGADVIVGSLIKNLGGGIAPTGGYIAGRADLLEAVAARVYAPGIGAGLGPTLGFGRAFVQGLFYAPLVVGETLRGLDFAASLFALLGFRVDPLPGERRTDIVQAIRLGSAENLIAFARGLQQALPINARFAPEPGPVPGYRDPVIMSSGAFVNGSTIDLSCDAPLRAPYDVYLQGGIVAEHAALGAILAAQAVYPSVFSGGSPSPMKP
jgi:cystathionine beta-lyase family protein involved in aluminum resistance